MRLSVFPDLSIAMSQNAVFLIRILLAMICGACIGTERSKRLKDVGVRTHIIVCCAAALIMIVSKYAFQDLPNDAAAAAAGLRGADPARIAAQAISGISFLGAGIIFKNGSSIRGLTTAAGIWATAAIGLALGAGLLFMGGSMTVLLLIIQTLTHRFTVGVDSYVTTHMRLTSSGERGFREKLDAKLKAWNATVTSFSEAHDADGLIDYEMILMTQDVITPETLSAFAEECSEIRRISMDMSL